MKAYAQGVAINPTTWQLAGPFSNLTSLVSNLYTIAIFAAGLIFFILIIFAGIKMIMSAGSSDPHNKEQAQKFLTYSVLGLIIIFTAYWIMIIINKITQGGLGGVFGG